MLIFQIYHIFFFSLDQKELHVLFKLIKIFINFHLVYLDDTFLLMFYMLISLFQSPIKVLFQEYHIILYYQLALMVKKIHNHYHHPSYLHHKIKQIMQKVQMEILTFVNYLNFYIKNKYNIIVKLYKFHIFFVNI